MNDIKLLHPELQVKANKLIKLAKDNGIDIIITQTLRSQKEQNDMYAQGRTKPGSIITNAKYPNSYHCWGIALDFAVKVGGKVTWDRTDLYKKVGALGKTLGLIWGGDFKSIRDLPHFEMPEYRIRDLLIEFDTPVNFINSWKSIVVKEDIDMVDYDSHWAKDNIKFCMDKGILAKTETFRPDNPLTRAEMATILASLFKKGILK